MEATATPRIGPLRKVCLLLALVLSLVVLSPAGPASALHDGPHANDVTLEADDAGNITVVTWYDDGSYCYRRTLIQWIDFPWVVDWGVSYDYVMAEIENGNGSRYLVQGCVALK